MLSRVAKCQKKNPEDQLKKYGRNPEDGGPVAV